MSKIKREFNAVGSDNKKYVVYVYASFQDETAFGDEYKKIVPDEIYKLSTGESVSCYSGTFVIDETGVTLKEI